MKIKAAIYSLWKRPYDCLQVAKNPETLRQVLPVREDQIRDEQIIELL